MSEETKGYVSDVFGTESSTDVRQPLEYNFVKSYPSVNSSNSGQIHSEENVRWLTKQFVKKPFIIQYDDNNMVEFNYDNNSMYASTATGGMVNIDGYIINTADDITKLSFDNTKDTQIGTGSTEYSGTGYINHVILQQAINAFMYGGSVSHGLTDSDIHYYTGNAWSWDWDTKKKELLANYIDKTNSPFQMAGNTTIHYEGDLLEYIKDNIQIVADGEYVDSFDDTHKDDAQDPYIEVTYCVNFGYVYDKIKFANPNNSTITYNDKEYPDLVPILFVKDIFGFMYIFNDSLDVTTNSYPSQTNVNLNFLNDDITPGHTTPEDFPISYKTEHIYDMHERYVPYTDEEAGIISYTGSVMDTVIALIPGTSDYGEYPKGRFDLTEKISYRTFMNNYLDDGKYINKYHPLGNQKPSDWDADPTVYYEKHEVDNVITFTNVTVGTAWADDTYYSKEDTSSTFVNYYAKLPDSTITDAEVESIQKSTSTYFGNTDYFDIVSYSDIFAEYELYQGTAITEDDIKSRRLNKICDSYYCLPVTRLNSDFQELFCLPLPQVNNQSTTYVPVGFITSSGALMAENVQYTVEVGGHDVNKVLVEGYASLLRRICKIVTEHDNDDTYKGGDISDTSETSSGWRKLIKDMQTGNVQAPVNPSSVTQNQKTLMLSIFNVGSVDEITFEVVYNTIIAPYMNFYLQLAWSSIMDKTLADNAIRGDYTNIHGRFKARDAYTVVKDINTYDIVKQTGNYMTVLVPKYYTYNGITYEIKREVDYLYNQYTDVDKLMNSLVSPNRTYFGDDTNNISYRETVDTNIGIRNAQNLEDYISYIIQCTQRGWDYNLERYYNSVNMVIPYRVTTLERDISTYGFKTFDEMVDGFVRYTNKYEEGNANPAYDYLNACTNPVTPYAENIICTPQAGYIQNVAIRTDNFVPTRLVQSDFMYPPQYIDPDTSERYNHTVSGTIRVSGVSCTICPLQVHSYALHMTAHSTIDYAGQAYGLSGFNATGKAQGWSVCIPTVFRLYKDSQNYLNGRKRGTSEHAGVYIDYKLPNDITDKDFWFANTWLCSVKSASNWDIESSSCNYPDATDGMITYLTRRNHTLFNINTIYDIDEYGNFISIDDIIEQYISISDALTDSKLDSLYQTVHNEIEVVNTRISTQPVNEYVEFINVDANTKVVADADYRGVMSNVRKLASLVADMCPVVKTIASSETNVYFYNNAYYNVFRDSDESTTDLNILTAPAATIWANTTPGTNNVLDDQRYVLNSTISPNTNSVMKFKINLSTNTTTVTIKLYTKINEFKNVAGGLDNYLQITWYSNLTVIPREVNGVIEYYEITIDNIERGHCLLELLIAPDLTTISPTPWAQESAIGWCNIIKSADVDIPW